MKMIDTDVCIIGSGPGGAAAFHKLLNKSGAHVTLLEAGPDLGNKQLSKTYDETKVPKWRRRLWGLTAFQPSVYANVGGASKFYASALFRFRSHDFEEQRYGAHVSPKWPITYNDLEPYYCEAERCLNVHGATEPNAEDPPRTRAFPKGPVAHNPVIAKVRDALEAVGWRPFRTPLGILDISDRTAPRLANAQSAFIRPALGEHDARGALLAEHRVTRLYTDPANPARITHVTGEGPEGPFRVQARVFVLAAGTSHSPQLLQNSGILGTGARALIGANYMFHQHTLVPAIDGDLTGMDFAKTLAFNDFYGKGADPDGKPFGHIQIMGTMSAETMREMAPWFLRPIVRPSLLRRLSKNMVLFLVSTEDLPLKENRIKWRKGASPLLRYRPTLRREHRALVQAFRKALRQALPTIRAMDDTPMFGNITLAPELPPTNFLRHLFIFKNFKMAANAHQCGTLKMGDDPASSVVSGAGNLWGMDNLYITDASVFPSSAHLNPSLTIFANSLRVAAGMIERHKL